MKSVGKRITDMRAEMKAQIPEGINGHTSDAPTMHFVLKKLAELQVEVEKARKQLSEYKVAKV